MTFIVDVLKTADLFISYRHHSYPLRHSSRLFIHCSNKHSRKIFRLSLGYYPLDGVTPGDSPAPPPVSLS